MNEANNNVLHEISFGGGCHWCTEAVFASLKGVIHVKQGWIASLPPHDAYSEAVLINYDPLIISLEELITIHISTHSSTSNHSMREKYRSAIYYNNEEDYNECAIILKNLQMQTTETIITTLLPFASFKENDLQYQDYYYSSPEKPFCKVYIQPKIALLKDKFSNLVRENRIEL